MSVLRPVGRTWLANLALSLAFWTGVLGLVWLDAHCGAHVQHADVFSAIWAAIEVIGGWLGAAGGAIATSLAAVVSWLLTAVQWLGGRVAQILTSTGAIFAKAWEGLKIVWSDVLRPALTWVNDKLKVLQGWLQRTFKPVFDFLLRIKNEVLAVYKRFVQPIIDTIEFIRALNRVLLALHINVLQKLDAVLQQIEQRIEEPILWINAKLNEIWNALDLVVTAGGLFQRLTLIRSMSRYAPAWINGLWNAQIDKSEIAVNDYRGGQEYPKQPIEGYRVQLADMYHDAAQGDDATMDALVATFRSAAGLSTTG